MTTINYKSWIALNEKEAQENLASLIEIIMQFQRYRDRALYHNKDCVSIEIENWQLQIGALLNIISSLSGNLKVSGHMIRLALFNENLAQIISEAQMEKISRELLEQLKSR